MSNRLKYLLLPIAGAVSAFLSFVFAAPYVKSLDRPWLKASDPESYFTYGTTWTNVQHATFGFLLCGSFCLILETGRRTPRKILQSTLIGAFLGAIANSLADSGSDLIGITAMHAQGPSGQLLGALAWFVLVPASLSFTLAFALGPTSQRLARALYSTVVAAIFTFIGRVASTIVAAIAAVAKSDITSLSQAGQHKMESSIPIWMTEAIVVGVALGLTTLIADRSARRGSLRLVFGRNEFRDWSLDYQANRIGSGEVEIAIRGFKGVEPVHSCIFRQGRQFIFDSQHFPALLNGYPVGQAPLNHGDTIQIGEATLVFYAGGPVRGHARPMYQAPMIHPGQVPMGAPAMPQAPIPIPGPNPAPMQAVVSPIPVPVPEPPLSTMPEVFLTDLAGKQYPLVPGENRIGREVGNTICLPSNTTVSRQHALIVVEPGQIVLSDVGSANGTRVNRAVISGPTTIKAGDEVAFGSATFTIHASN